MNRQPLVSVLTPSFNQVRWLGDNLRSVAAQSYPNVEHIVMDGGSTDGTVELLKAAGPTVRWRSEPDRGQSHALNKAFAESQGEIIGWLNSDDAYFSPAAVEETVRLFEQRPDVDVVYGHAALVNADGLILQMLWVPPFSYRLLRYHNFIIQPAAFIRRSALGDVIADESYDYAMDRELWLRLGQTRRFVRLNQLIAIDRHYPTRKSYARPDLARNDGQRLRATYNVPNGPAVTAARKGLKIAFRLVGASLIPGTTGPLAFSGYRDSAWQLLSRQMFVPRSAMPSGHY